LHYLLSGLHVVIHSTSFVSRKLPSFAIRASQNDAPRPNLVEEAVFIKAIETWKGAVAKDSSTPEVKDEDVAYAIGKLVVSLNLLEPGIDLVESTELVLVGTVTEKTAQETGILPGDTIVGVSAGEDFQKDTKALELDETAAILQAAANHALDKGVTEIQLELNRLIKGFLG